MKFGDAMTYQKAKRFVYETIDVEEDGRIISKVFDIFVLTLIVINVVLVISDTFQGIPDSIRSVFGYVEVFSVIVFTVEYLLRVWTATYIYPEKGPLVARIRYIFSFMAMVDLLAILPFYLPFIITVDLRVLRMLRLLRLMRILKLNRYTQALSVISGVLKKKASQLLSSVFVVLLLMVIASVLMYYIENPAQPEVFQDAFSGLWWAVATLTTVGYGDIYPITAIGKVLSAVIAMLGIGLVAVPTGIISAGFIEGIEVKKQLPAEDKKEYCPHCGKRLE